MTDLIIEDILRRMSKTLSCRQLRTLKAELKAMQSVQTTCSDDNDLLALFLTAKEVEGCSPKTLAYYENTINKMSAAIEKPYTQLTTVLAIPRPLIMCYNYFIMKHIIKGRVMAKTAAISMRIDPDVKSEAESIFANFGLTLTDAINVFLHKSIMEGGLPFDVRQPRYNAVTERAIQEARDIIAGKAEAAGYDSVDAMFAELDK